MVTLRPLSTTHDRHRNGGRKTHIANEQGHSLCGLIERADRFLSNIGDEIIGTVAIRAWIHSDADNELCLSCKRVALASIKDSS